MALKTAYFQNVILLILSLEISFKINVIYGDLIFRLQE